MSNHAFQHAPVLGEIQGTLGKKSERARATVPVLLWLNFSSIFVMGGNIFSPSDNGPMEPKDIPAKFLGLQLELLNREIAELQKQEVDLEEDAFFEASDYSTRALKFMGNGDIDSAHNAFVCAVISVALVKSDLRSGEEFRRELSEFLKNH